MPQSLLLIRHAEKPSRDPEDRGVDERGRPSDDDLTVRGWQRAGALAQFFTGKGPQALTLRPIALFAAAQTASFPSRRSISTLEPLARVLGVPILASFEPGDERALAEQLRALNGTALVAWEHRRLPALARAIAGRGANLPGAWPEDRFDMTWLLAREGEGAFAFTQIPQMLLAGDVMDPL